MMSYHIEAISKHQRQQSHAYPVVSLFLLQGTSSTHYRTDFAICKVVMLLLKLRAYKF